MKFWSVVSLSFFGSLIGFTGDRVLKYIALENFSVSGREVLLVGDLLKFKLAYNPGIAFGIVLPITVMSILYVVVAFVSAWLLVDWLQQRDSFKLSAGILIMFGAVSNVLDRIYFGHVVDYFDVKYYTILNLADVMIVGGAIILLALIYFKKQK